MCLIAIMFEAIFINRQEKNTKRQKEKALFKILVGGMFPLPLVVFHQFRKLS